MKHISFIADGCSDMIVEKYAFLVNPIYPIYYGCLVIDVLLIFFTVMICMVCYKLCDKMMCCLLFYDQFFICRILMYICR